MARLGQADLSKVLEVVRAVGQAQDRAAFAQLALRGVSALIPCLVASLNEVDPVGGRFSFWVDPPAFGLQDAAPELFAELAPTHPLIRYVQQTGDGSARRMSDEWSTEEFHASRLYRELYGPMGVEYQMSVILPAPHPVVLGLVVNRDDRDFSEHERTLLDTVRPHLAQGWRSARDQERLRALVDAAHDAVAERGWGLLVLSDPPEELTPGVLVTLYRFFGRPSRVSPLPVRVERWVSEQSAHPAGDGSLGLRRPLSARLDGRQVLLQYLPPQRSHPGAVVLREEPHAGGRRTVESLGLSAREADVVRLVMSGASNAAIASELHLAPGTVKKHLDNIYGKLGIRGRGPLTAFVRDIT